jgi:hypothetical protein
MANENESCSLEKRIRQTLLLAEERGYNLTIEQLSKKLLGGQVPLSELALVLKTSSDFDSDGVFIATNGNLYLEKCKNRHISNSKLEAIYTPIAAKYISHYIKLCPWVNCILVSGSMASDGLGQGDDIDLDIIVPDGLKYTSYFLAVVLSALYTVQYRKFFRRWYVVCISVVWECHQVLPFQRNDGQLAFELLNAKAMYNPAFFTYVLSQNTWLKTYFPQVYEHIEKNNEFCDIVPQVKKNILTRVVESLSRHILFITVKIAMNTVFHHHNIRHHIRLKYPYALFDIPKKH